MATKTQQNNFIAQIAPIIQRHAKAKGYKVASAIIAQACLESAYGASLLASKYHNYFGMKCGSAWKGASVNLNTKEEYTPGTLTTIRDNFRAYGSMEEGVKGYFDFISTSRYANLKNATSAKDYLTKIKADGYATSSAYVTNNMKVVEKFNLEAWDNFSAGTITTPAAKNEPDAAYKVGKNYTLQANMYVRKTANGEKLSFSSLTADGKAHAYKDGAGKAVLKKGTVVTCGGLVKGAGGSIWLKIPSGYVCGVSGSGDIYIK